MKVKIGDITIIAKTTPSGLLECSAYKGMSREKRTRGKILRIDGKGVFLSKSIEDAKRIVREVYGCETQTSLEDYQIL